MNWGMEEQGDVQREAAQYCSAICFSSGLTIFRLSRHLVLLLLLQSAFSIFAGGEQSGFRVGSLETEGQTDPLGVDEVAPQFLWKLADLGQDRGLTQESYRILVSSTPELLQRDRGDAWDSGEVSDPATFRVRYAGTPLTSHRRYFWKVAVKVNGNPPVWSETAEFTTGLLHPSEWKARWIAASKPYQPGSPLPIFRREFSLHKPVASALVMVSGLGQYELRVNGNPATDSVLNPGWTNYRKTVLYNTFDITRQIKQGANAFALLLGNGMYNVEETPGRYTKFTGSFGEPKLILQCEIAYADGTSETIVSDESWSSTSGPIVFSSTYGGEDFDSNREAHGWDRPGFTEAWGAARIVDGPGGELRASMVPAIAVAKVYSPVGRTEVKAGVSVYDLGQNMSGWPEIEVEGTAGSSVKLICGELLNSDGTVTQAGSGSGNSFTYTLDGGGAERWHPRFSYYGFRYVQVELSAAKEDPLHALPQLTRIGGDFVHAALTVDGSFESSDTLLNQIHTLIDMAIVSNSMSVLTDCPHREKLGWLEQTYLNGSSLFYNYDYGSLYRKIDMDMEEAQTADGLVPSIAPEYVEFNTPLGKPTAFRDSPEWGSAAILSSWTAYQFTGDPEQLEQAYPMMEKYLAYLRGTAKDNIIDYGLGDWYDIGPGNPGYSQLTSRATTATAIYFEDLTTMAKISALLDKPDEAKAFESEASSVRDAFNLKLFHADRDFYDRDSQTANAMPLALGMVPKGHEAGVLAHLVEDIRNHDNHVTAGDVGFHYVVRALTQWNRSDVLMDMLSRMDSPSYGYQLAHGATTLTEAWDANRSSSQNHFMLGHAEEWLYRGLAGIEFDMAAAPEARITIHPYPVAGVQSAAATYDSVLGMIGSSWRVADKTLTLNVDVPPNSDARILLPGKALDKVRIDDQPATRKDSDASCIVTAAGVACHVRSGHYSFAVPIA
jgi:hypothetical protein